LTQDAGNQLSHSIVSCRKTVFSLTLRDSIEKMGTQGQEKELVEVLEAVETTDLNDLVVFNDDFNTFEHVTSTLMRVCRHSPEQAEQCTWIIHYRGKCTVKSGSLDELKPMKEAICEAGIDARII
jgi:ATP-dependent Clp protease adaptor protein ClpS